MRLIRREDACAVILRLVHVDKLSWRSLHELRESLNLHVPFFRVNRFMVQTRWKVCFDNRERERTKEIGRSREEKKNVRENDRTRM